MHKSLAFCWLS